MKLSKMILYKFTENFYLKKESNLNTELKGEI